VTLSREDEGTAGKRKPAKTNLNATR